MESPTPKLQVSAATLAAAVLSTLTAVLTLGIIFLVRWVTSPGERTLRPGSDSRQHSPGSPAPQPDVNTVMPAQVPTHFTENVIVPGFTETGADIEEQDDRLGRSPEGV